MRGTHGALKMYDVGKRPHGETGKTLLRKAGSFLSSEAPGGIDEEHRGHILMQSGLDPGFLGPEECII